MASVFFDKQRKKWFAQVTVDGRRFGKRFDDKLMARRWAEDLEHDLMRTFKPKASPYSTLCLDKGHLPTENEFGALCEDYINKRVLRFKSYRENGANLYRGVQRRLGHLRLHKFSSGSLEQYAYERVDDDGVSVVTAKKEIEAIKRVLDYARRNYGWRPNDPFDWPLEPQLPIDTRADDEIRGRKDQEPITPQEFKQVLAHIKPIDHDVMLALVVLYETAMRRSEVVKLQKDWVQFDYPAHIKIPGKQHKNRKAKIVMLTPLAVDAMMKVWDRETEDGRVFVFPQLKEKSKGNYLWKLFKDACREVLGRPNLIVHNIRVENATQLVERGMDDSLRQRQTGHLDQRVLNDRYTRNRPEHRASYYRESFLDI